MADLFPFSPGRLALVTGGASGLGLGTARRLAEIGARVAIADLPAALENMAPEQRSRFLPVPMDVRDDASVAAGVAAAARELGGLDTLVNSAGVFQFRALEGITTAEWDRIIDVNLRGTFLVDARGDAASEGLGARTGGEHFVRRGQDRLRPSRRLLRIEVRRGRPDPGGRGRSRPRWRQGQRGLSGYGRRDRNGPGGDRAEDRARLRPYPGGSGPARWRWRFR